MGELMDLSELETRITGLEDLEAIKQLKALYCEICDDNHNPDRIVTIFTEDGIWEGKGIGTATGHAEIRALFQGFQSMMSFSQHMTMNPRIEVHGDSANGTWYFFGPFTLAVDALLLALGHKDRVNHLLFLAGHIFVGD